MTLPVSVAQVAPTFDRLVQEIVGLQSQCLFIQQATLNSSACSLQNFFSLLVNANAFQVDLATVTGNANLLAQIVPYAQAQFAMTSLSVTTEFSNVNTKAGAIVTALLAEYPKQAGTGILLERSIQGGAVVWNSATAAQAPQTMAAITAFLAALS